MPGNPFTDPNWAPDLADTVERTVGKVRTLTTDNAVKVSRALVFGVLGCSSVCWWRGRCSSSSWFGAIRELLADDPHRPRHAVWLSYMITGGS